MCALARQPRPRPHKREMLLNQAAGEGWGGGWACDGGRSCGRSLCGSGSWRVTAPHHGLILGGGRPGTAGRFSLSKSSLTLKHNEEKTGSQGGNGLQFCVFCGAPLLLEAPA